MTQHLLWLLVCHELYSRKFHEMKDDSFQENGNFEDPSTFQIDQPNGLFQH